MRDEIAEHSALNLARVRELVRVHEGLAADDPGAASSEATDVLRAAVVFLHATLEDVLRTLLERRWLRVADPRTFDDVPIATGPDLRQQKITLADLVLHRGKSVADLVQESIDAHLERSSFNHVGDIKTALARSGVDARSVAPYEGALAAMMSRRHQIVHRADMPQVFGSGRRAATPLALATVEAWIAAVAGVCGSVVAGL
jgi:hypothetical protein